MQKELKDKLDKVLKSRETLLNPKDISKEDYQKMFKELEEEYEKIDE